MVQRSRLMNEAARTETMPDLSDDAADLWGRNGAKIKCFSPFGVIPPEAREEPGSVGSKGQRKLAGESAAKGKKGASDQPDFWLRWWPRRSRRPPASETRRDQAERSQPAERKTGATHAEQAR